MVTAPAELGVSSGSAWSLATAGSADLKPKCWSGVMETQDCSSGISLSTRLMWCFTVQPCAVSQVGPPLSLAPTVLEVMLLWMLGACRTPAGAPHVPLIPHQPSTGPGTVSFGEMLGTGS